MYIKKITDKETGVVREVPIYNTREKMEYHMEQAKKGATDSTGKELSEFARGQHSALANICGRKLGNYKLQKVRENCDKEQIDAIVTDRQRRAEEKRKQREEYKAQRAAAKASAKAEKASVKAVKNEGKSKGVQYSLLDE